MHRQTTKRGKKAVRLREKQQKNQINLAQKFVFPLTAPPDRGTIPPCRRAGGPIPGDENGGLGGGLNLQVHLLRPISRCWYKTGGTCPKTGDLCAECENFTRIKREILGAPGHFPVDNLSFTR